MNLSGSRGDCFGENIDNITFLTSTLQSTRFGDNINLTIHPVGSLG